MVTSQQLAELLRGVNVAEVAHKAKVSTKTVYRLRHQSNTPNMATVKRLLDAIKEMQPPKRKPAKAAA